MTQRRKPLSKQKRKPAPPRLISTKDLCMSLAGVAAFHVEDKAAQMKIYEAIRRLKILEKAAIEAGLLADGEKETSR